MNRILRNQWVICATLLSLVTIFAGDARSQTLTEKLKGESLDDLVKAVQQQGNAVRGAILFSQQKLGCVNCHATGNDALLGPDLTRPPEELDDKVYVEALLYPSKRIRKGYETVTVVTTVGQLLTGRVIDKTEKTLTIRENTPERRLVTLELTDIEEMVMNKISSMPEKLADQLQDRQEFLDLIRYVIQLSTSGPSVVQQNQKQATLSPEMQGVVLIKELNCAACHQDDVTDVPLQVKHAPKLSWIAGRINPDYIQRYIADPLHVKPGTTMPDVLSTLSTAERKETATLITQYLTSLNDGEFQFQETDPKRVANGWEIFHSIGCVACHSPRNDEGQELLTESSVPLGKLGDKYNVESLVEFLKAPHEVRVSLRMPDMKLTHWEALDLAHYLTADRSASKVKFTPKPSLAARGRKEFHEKQCVQCHTVSGKGHNFHAAPLSRVRVNRGCLSEESGLWPNFDLSESERDAILSALTLDEKEFLPEERIAVTLSGLRCVNCHERNGLGGVTDERNSYFQTTNPNLGPQGRIPPTLSHSGAKLNQKWMRQVLVSGRSIRPYVKTRMPQFGAENVEELMTLIQNQDELPEVEYPEFEDQKMMRQTGVEMVGVGGLNCIACHTFQLKQAATMPAVDLTEMAERLQKPWFYHYMKRPQELSANTIMPSFWPGGKAIRKDILDGDPDLQIEALWQYLLNGRQARTPRGLIIEPIELLATDEAVMLRRSYPGVGKRGIGVGYPANVNLVFDAEQMRLATLWAGKFVDPGGVWRSQGHGRVRPLGERIVHFTHGPDLDLAKSPWTVDDGRPPDHQFRGYRLDEKRRPVFMYEFQEVQVEDYFVDKQTEGSGASTLTRQLKLQSEKPVAGLRLRLGSGKKIESSEPNTFLIDGTIQVSVEGKTELNHGHGLNDSLELYLLFDLTTDATTLTVNYAWPGRSSQE